MATKKKILFGDFRKNISENQKISVAFFLRTDIYEGSFYFQGTLKDFYKKYDRRFDYTVVFEPKKHQEIIYFELIEVEDFDAFKKML